MERVVHLKLSQAQASKIMKGKVTQLKPDQLRGSHTVVLDKENMKRYKRALKNGTGFRIKLNQEEIQETMNGSGIKDVFKSLKKTAKTVSKAVGKEVKKSVKELKKSGKAGIKSFAMDALASDNIKGFVKDNAKQRALQWGQDDALNIARKGVSNSIVIGERELEDALIVNHGFDEDLARQVVSAGSHRLSAKAYDELMNVDDEFTNARSNAKPSKKPRRSPALFHHSTGIKPNFPMLPDSNPAKQEYSDYMNGVSDLDNALMEVAGGAGLKYGKHFIVTKGGRLSFKKFLRGVRRVAKKVLTVGKPILKPLVNLGAQSLGAFVGGPTGAKIGGIVADGGYDAIQQGLGLRVMGGALYPMSYPSYTRGGRLNLYNNPKAGKYIV